MSNKKVTLKQIAEQTGVSLGTVHRAIYGKSGISDATRKRILEVVERTNYQLDEAASVLKRSARIVAVVLPKAQKEDQFYFRGIWRGIKLAAQGMEQYKIYFKFIESEYSLSEMWKELEHVYDELLEEIDGLITISDSQKANVWIERFSRRGIPTVLLSSSYEDERNSISCIKVDHARAGRLAAEFLNYGIQSRPGKILLLCGDNNIYSNRTHTESFLSEMRSYDKDREILLVDGSGRSLIEEAANRYLDAENILAVFAGNARNTYSICRILEERGQGQELLLLGTDIFEELIPYFQSGILNAVICQYHWEQGTHAVRKMYEYLSRGVREQKDEMLSSVLIMKSNYECFVNDIIE